MFIVFEGPDYAGKSEMTKRAGQYLKERFTDDHVVVVREPGSTAIGEEIRALIMKNPEAMTTALLFQAARNELCETVIGPALKAGKIVISDRFTPTTLAYQGGAFRLPLCDLERLNMMTTRSVPEPFVLYLQVSKEVQQARREGRGVTNWLDAIDASALERIRCRYETLAQHSSYWTTVDSNGTLDEQWANTKAAIEWLLSK